VTGKKHIAVIPGDGIGKEVIPQAVNVIQAAGAAADFTPFDWGADRYLADKTTVPPDGFATLARDFDAILVGAFGDPRVPFNIHAREILLGMRSKMDLFANVRPVRLLDASLCPLKGVEPKDLDFVVIRENTEGVYGDLGTREAQEDYGPLLPISTYGASKLAGEALIAAYCAMFGLSGCAFRFANVVGPRQTHGVGYDFVRRLLVDPSWTFVKTYFLHGGYLDGVEGLAIAYMASLYTFLKYAKARFMSWR